MLITNNKSKSSKLRIGIASAALCASFLLATNANQTVKADDIASQENQTGSEVTKDIPVTNAEHPDIPVQVVGNEDTAKTTQTESNMTTNRNEDSTVTNSKTTVPTIVKTEVTNKITNTKAGLQGKAINTSDNTWDNAQTDYDNTNHTLTIKGGSLTDPNPIYKQFRAKANEMQTIKITGKTVLSGSVKELFSNLTNLTTIEGIENLDTTSVTNMSAMFQNDQKLVSFGTIDSNDEDSAGNKQIVVSLQDWATDNVTDMSYMFQGCNSLYGLLLNVPTTKVQNFSHFASDCANLFLFRVDYSEASGANVTDWSYMLANDPKLEVAYVFFNIEDVTNVDSTASHMFYNDPKLDQVAFVGFGNLTDTSYMFANDVKVSDYLEDWIAHLDANKITKLTNMSHMLENCANLSSLNLDNFLTNDNLKADKTDMFKGLNSLQQISLGQDVNLNGTGFMPPFRYTAIDINTGKPTGKIYTATQLRKFWNNQIGTGFFVGTPVKYYNVTVNFVDTKTGKTLKSIAKYGNSEDPLEFKDDFASVIKELTENGDYTYDVKNNTVPLDKNGDIQLPSDIKNDVTYTIGLTPKEVPVTPTPEPTPTPNPTPNMSTAPTDTIITNVVVHYHDKLGNKLQADKTITGKLGGSWNAVPAEIKGYHLVATKGMATGTISDVRQEVTFVYAKDQPAKPVAPNKPNNKPTKPSKKPSKNKSHNKHHKPIVIDHGVILKPVNQQVSKESSANPTVVKGAYADATNNKLHNNTSYDNRLPQTGTDTKNNGNLVLLGLGSLLTAMLSLFGISKKKKL